MGLDGADSKIPASAAPSRLSSAALSSDPMASSWRVASTAVAAARLSSASQCSVANGSADVGEGQTRGSLIVVIVDEKGRRRESMVRDLPNTNASAAQHASNDASLAAWIAPVRA